MAGYLWKDILCSRVDRTWRHSDERSMVVVPCLYSCVRDQGADVAGTFMAARCARGSTDGRFCHSSRRIAEDGYVWVPAFQYPIVPRSYCQSCAVDRTLCDHRYHLRLGGFHMAGYREKTGC